MRKIVGIMILALVLGGIFFITSIGLGVFKAIIVWGIAMGISALIFLAAYLISS